MGGRWERIKRWVVPNPALPLDQQFFQALCLLGGLVSIFVVIPVNQFQSLSPWVDRFVFVFGVLSLLLAREARRGRPHRKTMMAAIVLTLDAIWFGNGGSQGSIGLYFFTAALFLVLFFEGAFRYLVLALLIANIIGLHLAERAWPQLVHGFQDDHTRLLDLATGYLLSLLISALMLWVVLEGFNREKARLREALQALRASEEKFSRLFEDSPDALLVLNPADGAVREVNRGFERIFGIPKPEAVGRAFKDLEIWPDPADHDRLDALVEAGTEIHGVETPFRRRDGSSLWGDVTLVPVQYGGAVGRMVGIRNATERHRAAEALAEREALYRTLLERQGEGLVVSDAEERLLFANPVAEQIFGVATGGLLGRSLREFVDEAGWAKVVAETARRARNLASTYELEIRRGDGALRTILVTATPGRTGEAAPLQVIGVFRDITEEKRAVEARLQLEQEKHQAQKMDSLGGLAGGVAHDFNNMLGGILGYADLLLADEPDPRRREWLGAIVRAASRSADLTRKLLAFGRRGRNVVESLDLTAMAHECLDLLRPTMSADLQVEVRAADCPRVDGDPSQVHQVLVNLCINAVEAMPEGGRLEVAVRRRDLPDPEFAGLALPPGAYAELTVRDSGPGMPEEVRQRVFEPFFTTKVRAEAAGTGLGLSTAYGIVQAHRGAILAESAPGRGSTFRVLLPAGSLAPGEKPAAPVPAPGQGAVLLVEDEPLLRELGSAVLARLGYAVVTAADGIEAVDAYRANRDRLCAVLLDLKMPRMQGREAFLEMRKLHAGIPVLVCTGFGENEEVQELLSLGAAGMLAKPYRVAELATRLEEVIAPPAR